MFQLYAKQVSRASDLQSQEAEAMSKMNLEAARAAKTVFVNVSNIPAFIGRGGCNIRSLQKRSDTLIYPRGKRSSGLFLVYYKDEEGLALVRSCAA
jgi:hypothetical protein